MDERGPTSSKSLTDTKPEGEEIPWAEALERLAGSQTYWQATVGPDGAPHVRPVFAVWVDGALFSTSNALARKARNLRWEGRCAFTVRDDVMDVVLEGTAAKVTDVPTLANVGAAYREKYGWPVTVEHGAFDAPYGAPTAGPPPYEAYRITPTTIFAFGTDESVNWNVTRWRF